MPADDHLRQHDGRRAKQDGYDIDKHECAAPAAAQRVRKLPDVAETDGSADGRQYEGQAAGPAFSRC